MRFICCLLLVFYSFPLFSQAQTVENKPFPKFIVYQDKNSRNRYTPSGYMPTGECLKLEDAWQQNCYEGKTCIKVTYDVSCSSKSRRWAGVYWLNPPDNWGDKKGGYNLTGAKKLVFWAKGAKGGETISEFKVGGVGNNRNYPDSDFATIGPVILTKEWKEYSIDLRDKDLTSISGGFAWAANVDDNPESCIFFLDDVHFE
ncbi:MAG: hypothetical protein HQL15_03550 [Candidatus Omnitrophica bacterium]|nr:hypothetical protein [Candidatus Omnitrophota bacterium]